MATSRPRDRFSRQSEPVEGRQMSDELILTDARIVTPDALIDGAVRVMGGLILDVDDRPSRARGALDLEGDYLLPGLVELHTDNLERQLSPRPGVRWPPAAALYAHDLQIAGAGITTVCDAVFVGIHGQEQERLAILQTSIDGLEAARTAGHLKSEHLLHLRCEVPHPGVIELFEPLSRAETLRVVSFMDHTPSQRQWRDLDRYREFHKGRNGTSDEEIDALLAWHRARQEANAGPNRRRILELVEGCDLALASHDDATESHVEEAAADGMTLCEFPTTIEAAEAARRLGLGIAMGARNLVLGGSHAGNVSALELARQGLLDALSSDYVPVSLLHGAFCLHERIGLPLPEALATVSANPARLIGLDDPGAIAPGLRADLVRVRHRGDPPSALAVWRQGRRIA
jgi:alpha-D-ribose 1-methylphosphonate 5-triphosphate diphosphatase